MPKYVQSKSSAATRKAQNKGVKHGTLRTGRSGRGLRKYNAKTGRWNLVAVTGRTKGVMGARSSQVKTNSNKGPAADFVVRNVSPASSNGSAKSSGFDWGYGKYPDVKFKMPKDWGYGR
jgi:hypothetical protein